VKRTLRHGAPLMAAGEGQGDVFHGFGGESSRAHEKFSCLFEAVSAWLSFRLSLRCLPVCIINHAAWGCADLSIQRWLGAQAACWGRARHATVLQSSAVTSACRVLGATVAGRGSKVGTALLAHVGSHRHPPAADATAVATPAGEGCMERCGGTVLGDKAAAPRC